MTWFTFWKKTWSLIEIFETFLDIAKEIRVGEKEGKLTIEVKIDENNIRILFQSLTGSIHTKQVQLQRQAMPKFQSLTGSIHT